MPIPRVEVLLDARPAAPSPIEEYVKGVTPVWQIGRNWCWAACVVSVLVTRGHYSPLGQVVYSKKPCEPQPGCSSSPPADHCDQTLHRTELQQLWKDWGFSHARFTDPLDDVRLRQQLKDVGPVQAELGRQHVVMVDGWRQGENGTVAVRVMDPAHGRHDWIGVAALRQSHESGSWTGAVSGLG